MSRGVTLFEILVAAALLAILMLLSLVGWQTQLAKARDAARKERLEDLWGGLNSYLDDNGHFPGTEEIACGGDGLAPYLKSIPCDPINNDEFKFVYESDGFKQFTIWAKLEWENDVVIGQVGCSSGCGPGSNYNYFISTDVAAATGEEGVPPTCGTNTPYCFANVCSSCCPGTNYRCNATGKRCIFDATCSE